MALDLYPIRDLSLTVSMVRHFSDRLFEVQLHAEETLPPFKPGQFAQVLVKGTDEVFLRRPISIYRYIGIDTASFLIQDAGRGTHQLMQAQVGDVWRVLMPLGNSFPEREGDWPLLVGGGVGVAPLLALGARILKETDKKPTFLLGARSASFFPDLEDFKAVGELLVTTEDASMGEKGFVTDHPILEAEPFSEIYTCGPTPMMKSVARWAKSRNIPCFASLENVMGCGMGVCLCCVEPTVKGHKTVCNDGPVFDVNELLWE